MYGLSLNVKIYSAKVSNIQKRVAELNIISPRVNKFYCVKSVHIWSYSVPHFPAFGLILHISPHSVRMWENTDQNNSEYGLFLHSVWYSKKSIQYLLYYIAGRACGTFNYQNLVRKFAKFPFAESVKWKTPTSFPEKLILCWSNVIRDEKIRNISYTFVKIKMT